MKNEIILLAGRPWMQYVWLLLITLLALALRFYKLSVWSFWIDEIYTISHAMEHFGTPQLILDHVPPNRNWVPVSVILTAQMLNLGGVNEWYARLTSAIIGVLTIPIIFIPLKKIFDSRVALISVLLLALSPWHIFWSQNARFYIALLFFYSLALFVFYFAIERDQPLYFIAFYILFYLAMSERLIAVLLIPVIITYLTLLWLLPFEKPDGFKIRNILILSAPIIAFLIYEIYLFVTTGEFIFASDISLLAPPIDSPIRVLIILGFSIGLPIVCLGFFSGIFLFLKRKRAGLFFLVAAVLPPITIALAAPFVFIVERYAFVSLLFWVVLAASGLLAVFKLTGKQNIMYALGLLFILLANMAGENLLYYQINHGNRLQWKEAVEFVRENMDDNDVVVSTRGQLASYYLGHDVLEFQGLSPEDLDELEPPIWFVMEYPGVWHGRLDSKIWIEEHARLLQFSYLRTREENSLLVYYFDPSQNAIP